MALYREKYTAIPGKKQPETLKMESNRDRLRRAFCLNIAMSGFLNHPMAKYCGIAAFAVFAGCVTYG